MVILQLLALLQASLNNLFQVGSNVVHVSVNNQFTCKKFLHFMSCIFWDLHLHLHGVRIYIPNDAM
jgi:hypothetical protein